jgi:hypothetical protein
MSINFRLNSLDYVSASLRDGRGAAFIPSPSNGELLPYGYQVVDVTAYNDMWGDYRDLLVCMVSLWLSSIVDVTAYNDMWGDYRDLLVCMVSLCYYSPIAFPLRQSKGTKMHLIQSQCGIHSKVQSP